MKLFVQILFFASITAVCYSAPTIMDSGCLKTWKMSVSLASDLLYSADQSPAALPDIVFRMGLPGGFDVGARAYIAGGIVDVKHYFTVNPSFTTSWDLDVAFSATQQTSFSGALIVDLQLTDFLNSYITVRWRIPANPEIDSTSNIVSGTQFIPRVGVCLFRDNPVSIILEGGVVQSGYSPELGFNFGGMVTWKL